MHIYSVLFRYLANNEINVPHIFLYFKIVYVNPQSNKYLLLEIANHSKRVTVYSNRMNRKYIPFQRQDIPTHPPPTLSKHIEHRTSRILFQYNLNKFYFFFFGGSVLLFLFRKQNGEIIVQDLKLKVSQIFLNIDSKYTARLSDLGEIND